LAGVAPRSSTPDPEQVTVTLPAAPRQVSVRPLAVGSDGAVGSDDGAAGVTDAPAVGPEVDPVVGLAVGLAVGSAGEEADPDRPPHDGGEERGGRGLFDRFAAPDVGCRVVAAGDAAGDPVSTSRPAASITRQVTAATATTVMIQTSTASAADRALM
jgi:hypothetical protein